MKKILLLPGDGIGPEIVNQGVKVLDALKKTHGLNVEVEHGLIGGAAIDACGNPCPNDTLALGQACDAIIMGAVGGPQWDSLPLASRPERGLLQIRKHFDLFANLRPAVLYPSLAHSSSLKSEVISGLDLMIVRELTGGIYFGEPRQKSEEHAFNTMVYHKAEINRVGKVAFDIAQKRSGQLCSVDKANVLEVSQLWRQTMDTLSDAYQEVALDHMYIDNACMQLVKSPKQFDTIVTSNLFGDIMSDIAAQLTGSIGMLGSASLNEHRFGLFEPVHGSAPDIAGTDRANPIALIASLSMALQYTLDELEAAQAVDHAIMAVLETNHKTSDLTDDSSKAIGCEAMGDVIVQAILQGNER